MTGCGGVGTILHCERWKACKVILARDSSWGIPEGRCDQERNCHLHRGRAGQTECSLGDLGWGRWCLGRVIGLPGPSFPAKWEQWSLLGEDGIKKGKPHYQGPQRGKEAALPLGIDDRGARISACDCPRWADHVRLYPPAGPQAGGQLIFGGQVWCWRRRGWYCSRS